MRTSTFRKALGAAEPERGGDTSRRGRRRRKPSKKRTSGEEGKEKKSSEPQDRVSELIDLVE
jgi:hypothetical protein